MKKVIIIVGMLCMLQLTACAQWYLFPGKKKRTEPAEEQKELKEEKPQTVPEEPAAIIDSTEDDDDGFFFGPPSSVGVSLILPVNAASAKPGAGFLEMYSGALLALRDI